MYISYIYWHDDVCIYIYITYMNSTALGAPDHYYICVLILLYMCVSCAAIYVYSYSEANV
jgi:hypothetical protein